MKPPLAIWFLTLAALAQSPAQRKDVHMSPQEVVTHVRQSDWKVIDVPGQIGAERPARDLGCGQAATLYGHAVSDPKVREVEPLAGDRESLVAPIALACDHPADILNDPGEQRPLLIAHRRARPQTQPQIVPELLHAEQHISARVVDPLQGRQRHQGAGRGTE